MQAGLLLVLVGAALWGTAGPLAQALNQFFDVGPLAIAFLRLALPVPLLALAARFFEGNWPWQGLPAVGAAGGMAVFGPMLGAGLGLGLFQVLFFTGVAHVGGGTATLIAICLSPIATALLAAAVLGERLTWPRLAALVLALTGVALLIAEPPGAPPGNALFGGLMAASASAAFALLAVSSRAIRERVAPLATVTLAFAVGAVVIAPVALLGGEAGATLSAEAFGIMAFLALGPTALGYILFFRGARRIPATLTGILVLAEPATATLLAWLAFGDRFGAASALGAALLAAAVVVISRKG